MVRRALDHLETLPSQRAKLIETLNRLAAHQDPLRVYALVLFHIFRDRGEDMDEDGSSNPQRESETQWSGRSCSGSSVTA